MQEIELKFQVPGPARAALARAVQTATAQSLRLQARYHDTPERRLAAAGFALRLRREGERWVQTLKGRGDGVMRRLEHEVLVEPGVGDPVLDLGRHAGTPAGTALLACLGEDAQRLLVVFETDILRTRRVLRAGAARIELALDVGEIRAGTATRPVHELEFELLAGPPSALLETAGRWVQRHGLWLDPRSKAEAGDRLARGLEHVPATPALVPRLPAGQPPAAAWQAMLAAVLGQALPNAAELAEGCGGPEHLHQLRVALRRLRSARAVYGELGAGLDTPWPAGLDEALHTLFVRLGEQRDRDVLGEWLRPALAAAGAPPLPSAFPFEAVNPATPGALPVEALLREPATTALWLALLAQTQAQPARVEAATLSASPEAPAAPGAPPQGLPERVRPRIERLLQRAREDAAAFATLDDTRRHRLRKRLKRLRYAVELIAPLLRPRRASAFLDALKPVQDALGEFNDLCVAEAALAARTDDAPATCFARGWLAAQRPQRLAAAAQALAGLPEQLRFWPEAGR